MTAARVAVVSRSRRWLHVRARALLALAVVALVVFCVVGVKSVLSGGPPRPALVPARPGVELPAWGLAGDFARAYLTWDARDVRAYAQGLARFIGAAAASAAQLPARGAQRVAWVQPLQTRADGPGRLVVVVEAQTDHGIVYLAVPVAEGPGGLSVAGWPALVGAPAVVPLDASRAGGGRSVSDGALRTVVTRALGNFLTGDGGNLQADLDPAAVVSLPPRPLTDVHVDSVVWQAAGTVAADVHATDHAGVRYALRYELDVVKRDRWYVLAIHTNPRN